MYRSALLLVTLLFTALSVSAQTGIPALTITPTPAEVGDTIEVLGKPYRIVEMEFVRYDTDEPYIVKLPASASESGSNSSGFTTAWVADSNAEIAELTHQVQVSGFPAGARESKGSGHTFFETIIPNVPLPGTLTVSYAHDLALTVAIGPETTVRIAYNQADSQQAETTIDALLDIIPLFDVIPMREQRIMDIIKLRTLLNYIEFRVKETAKNQ